MEEKNILEIVHSHHLQYQGKEGIYHVLGSLSMDISSMRISLHIERPQLRKERLKLDLYDYKQITHYCTSLAEEAHFNHAHLEADLITVTELLEKHREGIYAQAYQNKQTAKPKKRIPLYKEQEVIDLLSQPNLLEIIQDKLAGIGIAGEADNRLLLYLLGSGYKHKPLHAVIQSNSGSGKSHLINTIAACFPEEDVLSISRMTSKSLYHYQSEDLKNKLILIQDFDGLDDEALFAFRELQSFGKLTTSMTGKDQFGNHQAKLHTVEGHFASFGATTKSLYTDNSSRSILLKIDESEAQTKRILHYQAPEQERVLSTQTELQNIIRLLKPHTVFNPYINDINIPHTIPMARRLNTQLKRFIEHITFIHQYQRTRDEQGRLITSKEDIQTATTLFFDCLWLKVDELGPQCRQFFEQLKSYMQTKKEVGTEENKDSALAVFSQREIRQKLGISKTQLQRHIKSLLSLEYLEIVSGSVHRGYTYAIQYFDNCSILKQTLLNTMTLKNE